MKKILSIFSGVLTLLLSLQATAQENPIKDKTLLWRISGNGLTKPSYLFGTMHLICREDYVWTDKMKEGLTNSQKVCFEMNLNDPNLIQEASMALIESMTKKLMSGNNGDLMGKLMKMMSDTSSGSGLGKMMSEPDPMALQSMMGTMGMNCPNPVSYEDSIMKIALGDKKEIMGLEEAKEQIEVFETIPLDSLLDMILEGKINKGEAGSDNGELVNAYKNQDLPELFKLVSSSGGGGMDMKLFLDARNKKWIPRMAGKMKISSVFFAVGAGHLAGQNGVITLLRKDGYTVEPVK
jgi:uncharacterized protein